MGSSHHHHHHHGHNHGGDHQKPLGISIALNISVTLAQVIGGILSGSLALLSDALHNFSDVIALVISYVAHKLKTGKFSEKKTFGYKRAEIMAAFVNSATLVVLSVFLMKAAFTRFFNPEPVSGLWVVVLAALGIVVNGVSAYMLHSGSKENLNLKAAYLHLFSDFLSSVAVLLGGLLIYVYGYLWVDSLLTFGIALYLIYAAWGVLWDSLKVLMQFTPEHLDLKHIAEEVYKHPMVNGLHHLHVWSLSDSQVCLEAHVDFAKDICLSEAQGVMAELEKILKDEFSISHVTLQPEFDSKHAKELVHNH